MLGNLGWLLGSGSSTDSGREKIAEQELGRVYGVTVNVRERESLSRSVVSDSAQPHGL